MRKKILGILTAVSVMVLYLITGTAIVNAADTSQIGNSMDCTFYVHCETNIDKIAFNKTSISGQPTNCYSIGTSGTTLVPTDENWTGTFTGNLFYFGDKADTGDPLYWQTWTIIMIICCGFMIFSHHKFK